MSGYNDGLLRGRSSMLLDDTQRAYIEFEHGALRSKYLAYLDTAHNEAQMQYFLEANPILIPGLYDLHNGPVGNVVVSKLQLANEFVTDFAFISSNSAIAQVTLIEIESPVTTLFRDSDSEFTASFNKSFQQVRDWALWAEQHSTFLKDIFRAVYHKNIFRYQKIATRCILVTGRRAEVQASPKHEKRWASVNHDAAAVVMTYDRLADIFAFNARLLQKLSRVSSRAVARLMSSPGD